MKTPERFGFFSTRSGAILRSMLTLLALLMGISAQTFQPRTGAELASSLLASGLPVESVIIHTAESDPNSLLGRPNQYTAKVSWVDPRAPMLNNETCCTVEAFDSWSAYIARINYTTSLRDTLPPIFGGGSWVERSDASMTVLRMDHQITPAIAEQYRAWLGSL